MCKVGFQLVAKIRIQHIDDLNKLKARSGCRIAIDWLQRRFPRPVWLPESRGRSEGLNS